MHHLLTNKAFVLNNQVPSGIFTLSLEFLSNIWGEYTPIFKLNGNPVCEVVYVSKPFLTFSVQCCFYLFYLYIHVFISYRCVLKCYNSVLACY